MREKSTILILLLGTIVELCFFWANAHSIFLLSIIGLLFLILSVLFFKERSNLLLFVFLVPNQRIITFFDSTTSLLNLILIYLLLGMMVTFRSFNLSLNRILLWSLPVIYSFCLAIYKGSFYNFIIAVKAVILIILIWHFIINQKKYIEFESLATMFILGCIVASLIGLTFSDIEIGQRFDGGEKNNANILGGAFSFALACLSLLVISGEWKLLSGLPAALLLIVSGLMTQSRSFLLCLLITVSFTIFHLLGAKQNRGKIYNLAGVFLIVAVIVAFTLNTFLSEILNSVLLRVMEPRQDDISGGRLLLWATYYDYLVASADIMLFGIGTEIAMDQVGVDQVAHNAFLETIIGWGLLGFSIILISLISVVRGICIVKRYRGFSVVGLIGVLPIIVLLTVSMTGHGLLSIGFITQMIIGSLAIYSNRRKFTDQ